MMRSTPWVLFAGAALWVAGGCDDGGGEADADADADADIDADADGDGEGCADPCGAGCCAEGERCFREGCIADNGTCAGGEVCQGDTTCVEGVCVPFGPPLSPDFDDGCAREPTPLERFEPEVQCEWPGEHSIEPSTHTGVRVPPLVADLDGDEIPEIVFSAWNYASEGGTSGTIRVIRGDDCSPVWDSDHSHDGNEALALADLTGDGRPEVCGRSSPYEGTCVPFCLTPEGEPLWEGHAADGSAAPVDCHVYGLGISMANVDGAGDPEVVVGTTVFDGRTGVRLTAVGSTALWGEYGIIPAIADIDGDGHMDALTGGTVVDLVTGDVTADWGTAHGYTAVAELSAENSGPEVVSVSPTVGAIRVHARDGAVIFEHAVPGGHGGPPTVADLDGDGQPEFSAAGNTYLTAYDLDCVGTAEDPPDPGRCLATGDAMDGVLWSVETHEYSSGVTGSSVFDFEGDGAVEVVYGDECWTRVFDGATGAVKFSTPHNSVTGIEYPVIADVDGDFYTELVVTHEGGFYGRECPDTDPLMPSVTRPADGRFRGVVVYRDRQDRWAPSRPVWSQHTEHYYQRNDDGTVPLVELPSWEGYNSYRQAHPREGGTAIDSPDLTVGGLEAPACDAEAAMQPLTARVCNRGTLPVAAGVDVSFRLGSAAGEVLCTTATDQALEPGECDEVTCQWDGVPLEVDHLVVAVVDGDEATALAECHEDNNTATDEVRCPPVFY